MAIFVSINGHHNYNNSGVAKDGPGWAHARPTHNIIHCLNSFKFGIPCNWDKMINIL